MIFLRIISSESPDACLPDKPITLNGQVQRLLSLDAFAKGLTTVEYFLPRLVRHNGLGIEGH